ncbi:MAG: 2-oxoacid:ferredoxin oxidoreductase subunit beta [Proteobacteria bacterium]|nr:2-oxoacid:ferredoxin oxidoreductase subunit beta [Pseudomonadota bacterium]MCP4916795.1 2-oxoacid:ferredoxin oxidoreductase subunit beta [Pseudomonadota bacterium]
MSVYEAPIDETAATEDPPAFKKKDFMSDQTIRWCPGCGDYSILSQVQTVLADIGKPPHEVAVLSGIGCSSRFPYYMNTYGFHTIHGRAPGFATALKCVNPDLSVWMITGDGDGLSIGGNHLAHLLRRNVDLVAMLFNNRIYGLTKGQYSPTSEVGKKTKSSPLGSIDAPFVPLRFALGSGGSFLARSVDVFAKDLRATLARAEAHAGTSFVEIFQNCNIFNDGAFSSITDRKLRAERCLFLEHGKPMTFGTGDAPKGIVLDGLTPKVVELGGEYSEADCLVHDETSPFMAGMLVAMDYPDFPVPMGVLYAVERLPYDAAFNAQVEQAKELAGDSATLDNLLLGGDTWRVE